MSSSVAVPATFRWLLDTRSQWQDDFPTQASTHLSLFPPSIQDRILAYHFAKDRAMALGSALLKHHAVHETNSLPYDSISFSNDQNTKKPIYIPPSPLLPCLSFNVSHQAGLVALIGVTGRQPNPEVGIDIVCVNERNELDRISADTVNGFDGWVDMHAEAFAPSEVHDMKTWLPSEDAEPIPPSRTISHALMAQRLRRFYAFWALKEAYIKLRGDALLAPWLQELEFRNVRVPEAATDVGGLRSAMSDDPRHIVRDIQIWFRGERVTDVEMELRAVESNYMIATAVQTGGPNFKEADVGASEDMFPTFRILDIEEFVAAVEGS
ncbi:MAG: NADH:ubiquinone oxidoreductase [Chaenotheca gracillima]|nr:MAG: NADH:ubiquinone oxidoreductase [Chaenotheca gracillima]